VADDAAIVHSLLLNGSFELSATPSSPNAITHCS